MYGLIRLLHAVVERDDDDVLRQEAEDRAVLLDRVVPDHRPRTAARDERCDAFDVIREHLRRARRAPASQVDRLVGADVHERNRPRRRDDALHQRLEVRVGRGIAFGKKIAVRQLRERRELLPLERFVHVRERLLLGDQRDVKPARVHCELVELRGRPDVRPRDERMPRVGEDLLHVRRPAVDFQRRERANALLRVVHRRKRTARYVIRDDAPAHRRRVLDRDARQHPTRPAPFGQLRERHQGVELRLICSGLLHRSEHDPAAAGLQVVLVRRRPGVRDSQVSEDDVARAIARREKRCGDPERAPPLSQKLKPTRVGHPWKPKRPRQ